MRYPRMAWLAALAATAAVGGAMAPVAQGTLVCPPGITDPTYCTDFSPIAVTGGAGPVNGTRATLHGQAGAGVANGDVTTYFFEWGLTRRYGTLTTSHTVPAGPAISPVKASLRGLTPCTTYDYALVATNRDDTTIGRGRSFATRFARPVKAARAPRYLAVGRRVELRLSLAWPALVRASIRQGRRTVLSVRPNRLPAGTSVVRLNAPATPGRYSLAIIARLSCGHQRLTRRLVVSPPSART